MLKEILLMCAGEPGCASKTTVYYIVYVMHTPFRDDLKCGPAFWRHDYFSCPDCHVPVGLETHLQNDDGQHGSCCAVENGGFCRKKDDNGKACEKWRFAKDPEVAINAEVGLVLKFEKDENGYPTGCKGFEKFNFETIIGQIAGDIKGKNDFAIPDCDRQDHREPANAKTVADYVDDYADDSDLWLR